MTPTTDSRRWRLAASAAVVGFALVACTNPGQEAAPPAGGGAGDAQVVQEDAAGGPTCTMEQYGAEPLDLAGAVVGFSQSEPDTAAFRAAETASIQEAAEAAGVGQLLVTNANNELPKQIADIQSMLSQGAQFLIVAPVNSDGLDPALAAAKQAGVPVLTVDRKLTNTACQDYVAFLGSDFYEQGKRAADAMNEATGGTANVAILLGASGNNVTDNRNAGFKDQAAAQYPGLQIVAEQTGNFARDEGQSVTEQLLQSNPDISAVYAHNDEMALGAVVAVQAAGKQPGAEVKIVSIDGTRNAVQAIVDGQLNAVIESNPRFGPLAFETAQKFYSGEPVANDIIIEDDEYNSGNAAQEIDKAF